MTESEFTALMARLGGPDDAARNLARLIVRADETDRLLEQNVKLASELDAKMRLVRDLTDSVISALDALEWIKNFFRKLEEGSEAGDPLRALRKKYHAPLHAKIDAAIAYLLRGHGGAQPATQKRKESRWGKLSLI
jgi:hypothetical protein